MIVITSIRDRARCTLSKSDFLRHDVIANCEKCRTLNKALAIQLGTRHPPKKIGSFSGHMPEILIVDDWHEHRLAIHLHLKNKKNRENCQTLGTFVSHFRRITCSKTRFLRPAKAIIVSDLFSLSIRDESTQGNRRDIVRTRDMHRMQREY